MAFESFAVALFVLAFDASAKTTQNLVRNRADPRGHLSRVDCLLGSGSLRTQECGLISWSNGVDVGDVGGQHVHAHRAHDRCATATDEDSAASLQPAIQAVSVAGRNHREAGGAIGDKPAAIANPFADAHALHRDHAARETSPARATM